MITIDAAPFANYLGFLSLICYALTLMPTILRIVFPQTKQTGIPKNLLKHRRLIGIVAFILACFHGYLLAQKRNIDLWDIKTSWIYIQGVSTFAIFTILAITSNDWSVKRLKKNWKKLHNLTYLAMFLLTWHVWDKMSEHWSYLTPFGIVIIVTVNILFLVRRWQENQEEKRKAQKKTVVFQKKLELADTQNSSLQE